MPSTVWNRTSAFRSEERAFGAENLRRILTPKRLALWRAIRDHAPRSVLELAQIVGRDQKRVHRYLGVLVSTRIVARQRCVGNALRPVALLRTIPLEIR